MADLFGILITLVIVAVALAAYHAWARRTPGVQPGEEVIGKLIDALHRSVPAVTRAPIVPVPSPSPAPPPTVFGVPIGERAQAPAAPATPAPAPPSGGAPPSAPQAFPQAAAGPITADARDVRPGESLSGYALRMGIPGAQLGGVLALAASLPPGTTYIEVLARYRNPQAFETPAERDRRLALEQWERDVDVPGVGFPILPPEEVNRRLADFDAAMARGDERAAFRPWVSERFAALQNRGWKYVDINRKINEHHTGP